MEISTVIYDVVDERNAGTTVTIPVLKNVYTA